MAKRNIFPYTSTLGQSPISADISDIVLTQLGVLAYVVVLIGIAVVLLRGGDRLAEHLRLPDRGMPVALHVLGGTALLVGITMAVMAYHSDPTASRIYFLIPIVMASIPYGLALLYHIECGLLSRIRRKCADFFTKFR